MTNSAEKHELSPRREALLIAMVDEFITTAEPVGSGQIASHYSLGVRAAMVRNLMAELEELGYLHQPHHSAGRVPTDKAFRHYVDRAMSQRRIGFEDRAQIELHYSGQSGNTDIAAVMRETSRLLAVLSGQAALVMAPRLEAISLERVSFVRLRERGVMAIFVATAGAVHNQLVETERDYAQSELDRMAGYLNDSLHGRTLLEARSWIESRLKEDRARYDRFVREALVLGGAVAARLEGAALYVEGSVQALEQPEFMDRNKLRELLRALEDKTALLDLLERSLKESGPTVSIGTENLDSHLAGFSVVSSPYQSGSTPLGSLAVVGPVRMDYQRMIALVDYTARALSRVLEH
ncbi:MAG TPA: heat-inducible transcriptional repressor HrcA [Candidatus Binataceae bacterium]|jgi:heat-inducible transcriptional repressor|nr:heat-inducible transcriptional repressor HrcA [Candidatus Binataceae bacterium]